MGELVVTRLLQNPLGAVAPEGERGDIIQVSDGTAKVYLDPDEFDDLDEDTVRLMLSRVIRREGGVRRADATVETAVPSALAPAGVSIWSPRPESSPLTAPRPTWHWGGERGGQRLT